MGTPGRRPSLVLSMTIELALALIAAGTGGGIAASVASVASVVSYPALLALGLPPLAANVTNTMALVFSVPGSVLGSRPELAGQRDRVLRLCALAPRPGAERSKWRLAALFGVAVYAGYFGAAGGVLMLALLASTLTESLIRLNAIKNVLAGAANLVAALIFARYAPVDWAFVPLLALGFGVGSYTGQHLVRHLPVRLLRLVVAVAGLALAIKLGASAYR